MGKAAKKASKSRKKATGKKSAAGAKSDRAGMGRTLVVVESPAKAKTINRYLGKDYVVKAW